MVLLADYAITPDVFDVTSYPTEGECAARLETIREAMLTEGLVRDLRDGAWSGLFRGDARPWHRRGQELLKKMATQGRLLPCEPALPGRPADDCAWCAEALATDDRRRLNGGVIATESVKQAYAADPRVARIDRLSSARWWASRSPSVRLGRAVADYEGHLDPVLRFSNSLMFIDPHLDPSQPRYGSFGLLLQRAGNRAPVPRVEIHRVCYQGSGPARRLPMREDPGYFRRAFRDALARPLKDAGLGAEVFIWSDFHDRYLVSNLVGISLRMVSTFQGRRVPSQPGPASDEETATTCSGSSTLVPDGTGWWTASTCGRRRSPTPSLHRPRSARVSSTASAMALSSVSPERSPAAAASAAALSVVLTP